MGRYIWDHKDWPHFTWKSDELLEALGKARRAQGQILAHAQFVGLEAEANLVIEEAFTTSAIEGEKLNRDAIRSSVAKRLGLPSAGLSPEERKLDGLVDMLLNATQNHEEPLTTKRLHGWQAGLFPTGYSGIQKIHVGGWRKSAEPMQVVSGTSGKEKVHFEAPPSKSIAEEMKLFLDWWKSSISIDGLIRAGIAHLWFVTIHPYDDGNGRLARAITDIALAQDENRGQRLYSLSMQIIRERKSYYEILEYSQKHSCDITAWLKWFLEMYARALNHSEALVKKALIIADFWQNQNSVEFNERQLKVIRKLLEAEPQGFDGGITNKKYVSITKTSRETAKRDLSNLEKKGIVKKNAGKGRSVSYSLVKIENDD